MELPLGFLPFVWYNERKARDQFAGELKIFRLPTGDGGAENKELIFIDGGSACEYKSLRKAAGASGFCGFI